jgi:hypothetical protein
MLLFYDAPEYAKIITYNGLLKAITLGHTPIHPVFIALLWVQARIMPIYLSSFVWGMIGAIGIYLLSINLRIKHRFFPVLIYIMLPAVWIILINLMVESLALPLYIMSLLFLFLPYGYIPVTALMIGTHVQTLFWLPAQLIFIQFFQNKNKISFIQFILKITPSIFFGLLIYLIIFILGNKNIPQAYWQLFFFRAGDQFGTFNLLGTARMLRNILFNLFSGLSVLVVIVFAFLSAQDIFKGKNILAWVIFWLSVAVTGSVWTGDFMPRRIVYLAPLLALMLVRKYEFKSIYLIIYLLPIFLANYFLYLNPQYYVFEKINKMHEFLTPNSLLVQTHYLRPFTTFPNTLWLGQDNLSEIDTALEQGRRVFVDSQALLAPYYLYTGNNLHITSLNPKSNFDSQVILQKYKLHKVFVADEKERIFLAEIIGKTKTETKLKFDYSNKLPQTLLRARVNYGDAALWLWAILRGYREPIAVSLLSS